MPVGPGRRQKPAESIAALLARTKALLPAALQSGATSGRVPQIAKRPEATTTDPVPQPYPFARRDEIRLAISSPFLRAGSVGIEIGAGAFPSLLPDGVGCARFDKRDHAGLEQYFAGAPIPAASRSIDDIASVFPQGSDFLVAHNVLEHTADPIGTLLAWLAYVREGGVLILSLPHRNFCPGDMLRPVATFEHVLIDYALQRDATSLESREHFIAGCVGWAKDWPDTTKDDFSRGVLEAAGGLDLEHHFHVFDDDLASAMVRSALQLHGLGRILVFASPYLVPRTEGEIIVVIETDGVPEPVPEIHAVESRLAAALTRLQPERADTR